MNFRVGQKVVCVNERPDPGKWHVVSLTKGAVYTVTAITTTHLGRPGLSLAECKLPPGRSYRQSRFRPIVERKTETGMAILREILDRESHQDKPPVKRTVDS